MGHREDLLVGAKQCLFDKGYARTTARDIVAASGTNLGSIGYHFGSKEALMNAALVQATEEWGDELERELRKDIPEAASRMERFEIIFDRVIGLFAKHRALWAAQFEVFAQLPRSPEMRQFFAESQEHARQGLAALLQHVDPSFDDKDAQRVGSFYLALMTGVMAQLLTDTGTAPTGRDLATAVQMIATITANSTTPQP
ncbi:TetR/AcrR family transcriptional regulator [Sphaerisporangium sp. TRM90804]|uniref:TetR/AcrR family transcriptional regulator n=1 Tax=Sphaerisporangium sp. TRM90804 TaxID=3031113 RepID=UPI0024478CAE|nr:TetR/AcrR family transcriptional regulator [Sphaerisporangium sp. TRM90804]MDH2430862.1 TetR/AcrR family transcriptional regulator [Sphaerisporangium sp. TRM90804]